MRAAQIIGERQRFPREIRHAINFRVGDLALGATAHILDFGERAKKLVL